MDGRLVVWGAGELGGRVAGAWVAGGGRAVGLTRTTARHAALRQAGVEARIGRAPGLAGPEDALLLALPGAGNQRDAVDALAGSPPPARVVLISSTGFYGQPHGTVDEDTPPGTDEHARSVAATEAAFRAWAGPAGVVLRCGGLYRKGRGPLEALRKAGHAPLGPPDRTLALVHYDDAAEATRAALAHPAPEPVYLVVTPPCPTRHAFYLAACVLLELDDPLFDAPLGRPPADYDVTRLRRDLLPAPAHPRWQEALLP